MIKKSIAILLIVCMALGVCLIPSAAAASGDIGEDLHWSIPSGGGMLSITGEGDTIPDYSIDTPAPWAAHAQSITDVSLPKSIKHIGAYAFYECVNLKQMDLLTNVKQARLSIETLGESSFEGCGIRSIQIPYTVEVIPKNCFAWCEDLREVVFREIRSGGLDTFVTQGVLEIGEGAFEGCNALTTLASVRNQEARQTQLPSTLATIGKNAFSACESLATVKFYDSGENIVSFGEGAFNNCRALKSITLPTGITEIPRECFMSTGLTSIKLPANITFVGEDAFAFCTALKYADIYNNACAFFEGEDTTPDQTVLRVMKNADKVIAYAKQFAKPYEVLCTGRIAHSDKMFKRTAITQKASALKAGEMLQTCGSCGYVRTAPIAKIQTVKLTKTAFYYTGKKQCPSVEQVIITDTNGAVIAPSAYTVTCQTAGIAVGTHSVKIKFKSDADYEGSFVRYYTVVLKGTTIQSVNSGSAKLNVHWKKQTVGTNGYQIRLCKKSNFKSGVILKTVRNPKATALLINKGLARKTGYYLQIRTFRTVGKNKYVFSAWSKSFGRKTK